MNRNPTPGKITFTFEDTPLGVQIKALFDPAPDLPVQPGALTPAQYAGISVVRHLLNNGADLGARYEVYREGPPNQPDTL
jgi:hypothetical protein